MMHSLHGSHEGANTETMGFSLDTCGPADAIAMQVYDIYATKVNALRLAVDAAMTVLKVDQIVMSKPAGGPKPRKGAQDED